MVGICAAGITPSRAALMAQTSDPDRPGIDPVHAINGEAFAHEHREPAFAAVRRGVVDPRSMSSAGIEQDRVFESLVGRILVCRVDVTHPDFSGYLSRRLEASAVGGGAVHDLSAGFDAALLGNAQRFLRRRGGHAGNEQGGSQWRY